MAKNLMKVNSFGNNGRPAYINKLRPTVNRNYGDIIRVQNDMNYFYPNESTPLHQSSNDNLPVPPLNRRSARLISKS